MYGYASYGSSAYGAGNVPTASVTVAPAIAALVVAGYAPAIAQGVTVAPAVATLAVVGYALVISQGVQIVPAAASIIAYGYAPTITGPTILTPASAAVVVRGYAPSITQPSPVTLHTISITQDDLMRAIRAYILTLVTQPVLRTPMNRAAMPVGSFVAMSPGSVKALATNTHSLLNGARSTQRSSQFDCQIDCYGIDAGNTASILAIMFRDQYAVDVFPETIVPLYSGDPHQMPIVTGEEEYLERWTFEISLQFNPIVSMPTQSATMLELSLCNVNRTFPP